MERHMEDRLTHEEREARRKKIAARMIEIGPSAEGVSILAREFSVTVSTVRQACKEHRVKIPRPERAVVNRLQNFALIADLIAGELSQTEIADKHKITRQFVGDTIRKCREHGIFDAVKKRIKILNDGRKPAAV
jgi:hypothetical protein